MKTQTKYKPLSVGDIRQPGDETRHTGLTLNGINIANAPTRCGPWSKVSEGMVGHVILPADVIAAEFQRPI